MDTKQIATIFSAIKAIYVSALRLYQNNLIFIFYFIRALEDLL